MYQTDKLLTRDPYLQSHMKPNHYNQHHVPKQAQLYNQDHNNTQYQQTIQQYQRQLSDLEHAYSKQQTIGRKLLSFQNNSNKYHETIKQHNYELNTKLNNLALQTKLMTKAYQQDSIKNCHDKDILITRYEEQTQQILELKRTIGAMMEHKSKLQEQISHLMFLLEKEAQQNQLAMKQQLIRAQNSQQTYKQLAETKDEQIRQLHHRLRLYEDENRKLAGENKTLQLTSNRIDNLSQIQQLQSQMKQNKNTNEMLIKDSSPKLHDTLTELKQQKRINQALQKELEEMKHAKQLFQQTEQHKLQEQNQVKKPSPKKCTNLILASQSEGLIKSVTTLRNAINKQIFEIFFKSVREGEKRRQNSLVIFIQNWKCLEIDRVHPYIKSYLEARNSLKQLVASAKIQHKNNREMQQKNMSIEQCIPLYVGSRTSRNQINQWILSTIQFTKNQRETSKNNINNALLFLFRLLTIQYRITYPMQGKSYTIDTDVRNELLHQICKAVTYIIQLK